MIKLHSEVMKTKTDRLQVALYHTTLFGEEHHTILSSEGRFSTPVEAEAFAEMLLRGASEMRKVLGMPEKDEEPQRNRFKDAVNIWGTGASNPVGVTHTLLGHLKSMLKQGIGMDVMEKDAALRLIVHQLASLFGVTHSLSVDFGALYAECQTKAQESVDKL